MDIYLAGLLNGSRFIYDYVWKKDRVLYVRSVGRYTPYHFSFVDRTIAKGDTYPFQDIDGTNRISVHSKVKA